MKAPVSEVAELRLEVLAEYPHDPRAFTQGLIWHRGALLESTGLYGTSSLRRVRPSTGEIVQRALLDPALFAEGLTRVGNELTVLTWKAGLALVFDQTSFQLLEEHSYRGEGWGLTYDGQFLIMSDGSHRLTYRDPDDFRPLASLEVTFEGRPLQRLNELEWTRDGIYANIWGEDRIVVIDPETGRVTAQVDAGFLLTPRQRAAADVLNGIAYDPSSGTFWVTGKYWPKTFQVRILPRSTAQAPAP